MTRPRPWNPATSRASIPIRTHCVLGPRGVRSVALRVFCPQRLATIPVETCERCPRAEGVEARGDSPHVACYPSPAAGAGEVAGELVRSAVLCVVSDVPLDDLEAGDRAARLIPVVDEAQRYVGAILQGRTSAAPSPRESDAALLRGLALVEDAMEHVPVVNERDDVLTAAAAMISGRARSLPVVNDDAIVVGVLDDVALLGSFARAHAPSEPTGRCSCGRAYSRREWLDLPPCGSVTDVRGEAMELRSCKACGGVITARARSAY